MSKCGEVFFLMSRRAAVVNHTLFENKQGWTPVDCLSPFDDDFKTLEVTLCLPHLLCSQQTRVVYCCANMKTSCFKCVSV